MLFTYYKMKILEMMIVTGIFSQTIFGERHNLKIKRQIIPSIHNEGVADYNSLQYQNENQIFQERYLNRDEEMVGLFPIGLLRGAARHITRRVKSRSRFHHPHPHLLQPTPNHLLEGDETLREKESDRHDVNELNPILQSPLIYHEEPSPNARQLSTPQTVIHNTMRDHYEPLTAGKIICNYNDPEETVFEPSESKYRHSSGQENVSQEPHDATNHLQVRHFHHKGNIYSLINEHLQKHSKFFGPMVNHDKLNTGPTTPYSDGNFQYNDHGNFNNGQNNNLPQSSTTHPISSINGDKITINQNFQVSQIDGSNNGVSQAQTSNKHSSNNMPNDLAVHMHDNQNYQENQIEGNYNAVGQSQASHNNNRLNMMQDDINKFFANQNEQISQIYGNNNAVTQAQESNHHYSSVLPDNHLPANDQTFHPYPNMPNDNSLQINGNENFQMSNINGNNNVVTQGQTSNHNFIDHNIVGAPYLINFEDTRHNYYPPERSSEEFHPMKRRKRQIKIWNLITDPNSQLDMSQTIENVGHAARNAMENEQHPGFHIKNAVGSAKNAVMSSMRIVPQSFIIPSDYKIVGKTDEQVMSQSKQKKTNNRLQAINQNLLENLSDSKMRTSPKFLHEKFDDVGSEDEFVKTYAKVGSMVRDSVRSSKETLNHIGDAYSNARKAVAVARHSAPKMLMRSMRIPEVRRNFQYRSMEKVGSRQGFQDDFVGASEMMNSFGILTPKSRRDNFKRNVVTSAPSNPPAANTNFDGNIKPSPKKSYYKYAAENVQVLNDLRDIMGVKSLNELLAELEHKYNAVYDTKMKGRNSQQISTEIQQQSLDTRNTFDMLRSLADKSNGDILGSNLQENKFSSTVRTPEEKHSNIDYKNKVILSPKCRNVPRAENLFDNENRCAEEIDDGQSENLADENKPNPKSRISMTMGDKLVTPYMGKLDYDDTKPYYDNYKNGIIFYK